MAGRARSVSSTLHSSVPSLGMQVRKAVAEHLYVWLLTQQDCHPDLEGLATDTACDVLAESVWDGPLQEARTAREALYGLLQLKPAVALDSEGAAKETTGALKGGSGLLEQSHKLSVVC